MTNDHKQVTSLVSDSHEKSTESKKPTAKKDSSKNGKNRRKSRELVVKAVYRGMLNHAELKQIFLDMKEDPEYNRADEDYFKHLLNAVTSHLTELDAKLVDFIDRPIAELSPIEHAILRTSGCELMFDFSIPYRVVINEGVELAKVYGGIDGHKYINGVLDKLAAAVRASEVKNIRS